jgi:Mn2+/Fe2+ NRAMP family transporter
MGRTRLRDRVGATDAELRDARRDILFGMTFSSVVMYFIMLATASTVFKAGGATTIESAAGAAAALQPLAGRAAGILFALGVVGVGFLAVPVMTTGAAYDVAQSFGWRNSLGAKPKDAAGFYVTIVIITAVAVALNFVGWNPMRVLVWAGIVQGFSTPFLMLLILLMTNNPRIMGDRVNSRGMNILAGITTIAIFSATAGLVIAWWR